MEKVEKFEKVEKVGKAQEVGTEDDSVLGTREVALR